MLWVHHFLNLWWRFISLEIEYCGGLPFETEFWWKEVVLLWLRFFVWRLRDIIGGDSQVIENGFDFFLFQLALSDGDFVFDPWWDNFSFLGLEATSTILIFLTRRRLICSLRPLRLNRQQRWLTTNNLLLFPIIRSPYRRTLLRQQLIQSQFIPRLNTLLYQCSLQLPPMLLHSWW